jgi:hypothetical protein
VWLCRVLPTGAGTKSAVAGGVYEAGWVPAARDAFPVMDEVAGGYRLAGDVQPPPLPVFGRLGWLVGGQQVFPAERAPCFLLFSRRRVYLSSGGFTFLRRSAQ